MEPVSSAMERAKLRAGIDERKNGWVAFPNGRKYLLPVVARGQKLIPQFGDDGEIAVGIKPGDTELAKRVDEFLELVATVDDGNIFLRTAEQVTTFFRVVAALLMANYELANEELTDILSMTNLQLSSFFSTILLHVARQ